MTDLKPTSAAQAEEGGIISRLTTEFVQRHARLYGHEPRLAHLDLSERYLVVVMEGTLTAAERTMVSAGSAEAVERTRVEVQRETLHEVRHAVELLTGRRIRAVLPQVDATADILLELYILDSGEEG